VGVSPTFEVDPNDKKMMTAARRDLEVFKKEAETTIIKMHKFVMKLLDISPTT
jgi:hypothetical protein